MFDSIRYHLSRLGRWPRLVAAGMCFTLAGAAALDAHAKQSTVAVVVARHALRAGQTVQPGDLQVVRWPRSIAPPGTARSTTGLIGHRAASAIAVGEPMSATRVVGTGLTVGLPRGTRAMSVPVADARIADYLAVGDRVDLYAAPSDDPSPPGTAASRHIAAGLPVLAVLPPRRSGDQQGNVAAELVVAVDAARAAQIAVNSPQMFAVVVDPP